MDGLAAPSADEVTDVAAKTSDRSPPDLLRPIDVPTTSRILIGYEGATQALEPSALDAAAAGYAAGAAAAVLALSDGSPEIAMPALRAVGIVSLDRG